MSQPMFVTAPTLGSGNLRDVVRLPDGEDKQEWLAVNILDVFKQLKMVYGTICDVCTQETCPVMSAGQRFEYYWSDGNRKLNTTAPQYIDYVMCWVQDQLDDEKVFPSQLGNPFPTDYENVCQVIMKRLFRVYAHVYHSHAGRMKDLKATAHLNTSFKQFILFAKNFNLIPEREMDPLRQIIDSIHS